MTRINSVVFLLMTIIVLTASAVNANVIADSSAVNTDAIADSLDVSANAVADSSITQDSIAVSADGGIMPDSSAHQDTIAAAQTQLKADTVAETSGKKLEINPDARPKTRPDTSTKMIGAYWGAGIGLSAGSVPIFDLWRGALPDNSAMNQLRNTGKDLVPGDTLSLPPYAVSEEPDQFNFTLPFSVSLYSVKENSVTAISLSFFQSSKQLQSAFYSKNDTMGRRISIYETFSYYSVAIEAAYMRAIPQIFFSIDGAQQSYLSVAAGFSPINTFSRTNGIKNESPENDLRMQALKDSAASKLSPSLSGNGMSVSWRIGISMIRNTGQGGSGLDLGLYYAGSYSSLFYNDSEKINRGQLDPTDKNAGKPLTFLSNRIEFRATFLMSANRDKLASQ